MSRIFFHFDRPFKRYINKVFSKMATYAASLSSRELRVKLTSKAAIIWEQNCSFSLMLYGGRFFSLLTGCFIDNICVLIILNHPLAISDIFNNN